MLRVSNRPVGLKSSKVKRRKPRQPQRLGSASRRQASKQSKSTRNSQKLRKPRKPKKPRKTTQRTTRTTRTTRNVRTPKKLRLRGGALRGGVEKLESAYINDFERYTLRERPIASGGFNDFYECVFDSEDGPQTVGMRLAKRPSELSKEDIAAMKLLSDLQISPTLIGYGLTSNNRPWQAMELYTASLDQLLTPSFCTHNNALVSAIEEQLLALFAVLSEQRMFCFDVKLANTVYKFDEAGKIVVKLIDMDNKFCFFKVDDAYLANKDILYAQMLVFNHNSAEPKGECVGGVARPFFESQLFELRNKVNMLHIKALLAEERVARMLLHYDELQQGISTFSGATIADNVVKKALNQDHLFKPRTPRTLAAVRSIELLQELLSNKPITTATMLRAALASAVKACVPDYNKVVVDAQQLLSELEDSRPQRKPNPSDYKVLEMFLKDHEDDSIVYKSEITKLKRLIKQTLRNGLDEAHAIIQRARKELARLQTLKVVKDSDSLFG